MSSVPLILSDIPAVRRACDNARSTGKRVALVPTMGALHQGHLALMDKADALGDFIVVTIFVNPTQFGPGEDLDCYPSELESDVEKLTQRRASLIFTPTAGIMYPEEFATSVSVSGLTDGLCGASRPSHFQGVTTVVSKLFNIVGPCVAIFGRKDYQQLQVIKKMASDLDMPIEIVGVPTHREPDGLAMSSRNAYLSKEERGRALALSKGLAAAHGLYKSGERKVGLLRRVAADPVEAAADEVDYITAADPDTLDPLPDHAQAQERLLIAMAAKIGSTRLIDNAVLGEDDPPLRTIPP
ncbi:MAG: pantoate--beta-alanine ligase [Proteobacteria bacterium]|nr:pantoate--beta-alanine ligase [Pseudomonadota bacterium]